MRRRRRRLCGWRATSAQESSCRGVSRQAVHTGERRNTFMYSRNGHSDLEYGALLSAGEVQLPGDAMWRRSRASGAAMSGGLRDL
eukprot:4464097-Prymnesium_polylepis.1